MAYGSVDFGDGLVAHWAPVNQAWVLLWGDSHILGIFNTRTELNTYVSTLQAYERARDATRVEAAP